jgi:hypothetical protein
MSFWDTVRKGAGLMFPVYGAMQSQADTNQQRADSYANRGDPYAGMPLAPTDAITSAPGYNRNGLDRFEQEAFRTGPSNWAKLATQQQQINAGAARDRGTAEVGSQLAKSQDQLAMDGGLTSGARERLATSAGRNQLDMSQGVGKEQADNNLQLSINDEQNRISQLGQVPGMEMGAANFDLSRAQGINQFNASNYQTQGGIWAAGKQADAEDPRNPQSPVYDDGKRWYNPFTW